MIVLFETMSCRSEAAVFFSQGNGYIFAASRDHRLPLLNLLRLSLAALSGMGLVLLGFFIIKARMFCVSRARSSVRSDHSGPENRDSVDRFGS